MKPLPPIDRRFKCIVCGEFVDPRVDPLFRNPWGPGFLSGYYHKPCYRKPREGKPTLAELHNGVRRKPAATDSQR